MRVQWKGRVNTDIWKARVRKPQVKCILTFLHLLERRHSKRFLYLVETPYSVGHALTDDNANDGAPSSAPSLAAS